MPPEPAEAFILRRTRYSETSLVVVAFTRRHGRIDALAKGCRRPKSPMRGCLDLYNHERLMILKRSRGGLDLITDTSVEQEFACLRRSPLHLTMTGVIAEILRHGLMVHDPHPRGFDALIAGLRRWEAGHPPAAGFVGLWLGILADLGFAPRLDRCVRSDRALPDVSGLPLSGRYGGLLHPDTPVDPRARRLPVAGLQALRALSADPAARVEAPWRSTLLALGGYTEAVLERPLRSLKVLGRMWPKSRAAAGR